MTHPDHDATAATATSYRRHAETWFAGHSEVYADWATHVAATPTLAALIATLPPAKRQPNLVFAASRFTGCRDGDAATWEAYLHAHWPRVREIVLTHRTQTNEAGRCATLLPALGLLAADTGKPLALIEVGPSAGLCLLPDLYSYEYDGGTRLGSGTPLLRCATTGTPPLPAALPEVASRSGVDLNPLDGMDPQTARWLEALVWPGQDNRLATLRSALATLATLGQDRRPRLVAGDLNERVAELVAAVPATHTAVVFHTAVLAYLSAAERSSFAATVRSLDCRWLSNENFLVDEGGATVASDRGDRFTLALDGVPLAYTGQHGATLDWIG
ncbi:DUF2332 domain-containing protein [Arthrobacter sp. JSM 101049]|uniref:DUF2332 domain-containing protein n=1 Tax=Arthrobacter sp. JSM 101049 TaxID=929097 RepID=UPI00356302DB